MSFTTDPTDPRLGRGIDEKSTPMHEVYLVLSEEERSKGFIRPVRRSYKHVGPSGPKYPLRDLTEQERIGLDGFGYVKYEAYRPMEESAVAGRYWTQAQLDTVGKGCQGVTTMNQVLAETYARNPTFYGATYCVECSKHLAVDEFVWAGTNEKVGS